MVAAAACLAPSRRTKRVILVVVVLLYLAFAGSLGRWLGFGKSVKDVLGRAHHLHGEPDHAGGHSRLDGHQNEGEDNKRNADEFAQAVAVLAGQADSFQAPLTFGGGSVDWSAACGDGPSTGRCLTDLCGNGHFMAVGQQFALLQDAAIVRRYGHGRRGGEQISDVLNQNEEAEYWKLDPGFFNLGSHCSADSLAGIDRRYSFHKNSHLNQWLTAVRADADSVAPGNHRQIQRFTIAVTRYEYVNLYHTMTDFYNAYLVGKYFGQDPGNVSVLFIDGHPAGSLDNTWRTLFAEYHRVGDLPDVATYAQLSWGWLGYASPLMNHGSQSVPPLLDDFRLYFLQRHGISAHRQRDCSHPRVLFVWRRDYVAHPRNPAGIVSRKVKNEDELLEAVRTRYPGATVSGQQTDLLPVREQLALIADTDVLVGMHGAGLTLALFLPPGAGLVELYPTYWSKSNEHFKSIARWRKLAYAQWQNGDQSLEDDQKRSYVPKDTLLGLVEEVMRGVCQQL